MGVGSVVMATVGDEAALRDDIPVTGRERIVLFGAPSACTVELYLQRCRSWNRDPFRLLDPLRLNKNWGRLSQRSIGAVVSRYAHQVRLGRRSTPIRCATPSPPTSSWTWIITSRWPRPHFRRGLLTAGGDACVRQRSGLRRRAERHRGRCEPRQGGEGARRRATAGPGYLVHLRPAVGPGQGETGPDGNY